MSDRHNPAKGKKKDTERSPLHCISRWRRVKTDLILTIVTYRTDVNNSWAPEGKTNNHNVRFPVTWGCFLTKNYSSMLLVLRCRSASNFSLTYHCLNVQMMINMMRIGHFRVPPGLCFKTRVGPQPCIWKSFLILMQITLIFSRKVVHLASFWKWGFLELGSGLLECKCWYWGYKGRRQHGRAVSALDLQSEDPRFNTRPNRLLDLIKSSTKVVNIQLISLYAVGIVSLVTFHYQPIPSCPKPLF